MEQAMISRLSRALISAGSGRSFWNERFVPDWLPALLGLAFGVAAGVLIVTGRLVFLIPLACIVPATVLFLRYPFAAVLIWSLVFPFVVENPDAGGRLVFTLVHRLLVPAALGIAILSDWLRVRKHEPVRFGRAELVMLCFLLVIAGNIVLLTPNIPMVKQFTRFYDRLFVPFCIYWLIRLVAPGERDFQRLAWVAVVVVLTQVVIGLMGWFTPGLLPEYWLNREGQRTVGTLGNPAVYTSTLLFFGMIALRYAIVTRAALTRVLFIGIFGLAYIGVFFSFSRGSWLGGLLVWAGLMALYPKLFRRLTSAAVVLALIAGATLLSSVLTFADTRLQDADTAQGRILGAATQINMIETRPFFGWGYYSYDIYDEQFKQRVGNIAVRDDQTSHNQFLLIVAEMGVVGLVLYIFPAVWWLRLSTKMMRRLPEEGFGSWRLVAMLWLLLLHHFVVNNFMEMIESYLFGTAIWWMALGLIGALLYPYLRPSDIGAPKWASQPIARST
jgi:O-antigen ligase